MSPIERTLADFDATAMTTGPHPIRHVRDQLRALGVLTARQIARARSGRRVKFAGLVICRQRPQTKTGVVFLSVEDETGIANAMVSAELFERERRLITTSACLLIEGRLDARDGAHLIKVDRLSPAPDPGAEVPSHDWG